MKTNLSAEDIKKLKCRDKIPFICEICNNIFYKNKNKYLAVLKGIDTVKIKYCSRQCFAKGKTKKVKIKCITCNKITKNPKYCSCSCAAVYSSKHKTKGTRRSKLEVWLEAQLTNLYPNLKIDYNKKDIIGSELDIYIPSLKLAIELNGIFHYEPIYGQDKLDRIQNNDLNKFQECQKLGISLCVIDASSFKNFKEVKAKQYLDIILNLLARHFSVSSKTT